MEPVVLENVRFYFTKGPKIVENFTMKISKGEFVYLKGSNGSGKSTFLKLLVGIIKPKGGKIKVLGKEPYNEPEVLKKLGVVVDGMGLYKNLSLKENIIYFAKEKGFTYGNLNEELEKYEKFWDIDFNRKYKKSSHGMRKIAKLTLSLINEPELLIWEEPELALDKERIDKLMEILTEYKEKGNTCIIAGTNYEIYKPLVDTLIEKISGNESSKR
ncbi:ATP-binding cassette domain-containing protein [Thermosipho globiformans]|uniref:ATP-binding cassette domain-containing protein n=1 Tax=Thermosipho globiformans TaxID=380685 RepID=UPI0019D01FFF|nr:ABC transporter ATP-binding protein [Thermosipho globiformans]